MMKVEQPVAIVCVFTWVGFVCAISFLEAWLKFRAPDVTISIGLGIGRLVFNALNKIEWVFAIAVVVSAIWHRLCYDPANRIVLPGILIILSLQTFWLLPLLDARAELYTQGKDIPPSNTHLYFIAAEMLKVVSLAIYGISLFKKVKHKQFAFQKMKPINYNKHGKY